MTAYTLRPRLVARACTVTLWAVGSAALVWTELQNPNLDPVVLYCTPAVWAVVLALPVLSTYARNDGQWTASALLWVAAIVGSAYMLNSTLGRQAEGRDVRIERAQQVNAKRATLERELSNNQDMLAKAVARCGEGRRCLPATEATIKVYRAAVAGVKAEMAKLPVSAPNAGEQRIAWLIALMTGADVGLISDAVGALAPALFGVLLEVSALACAMYGWHPVKTRRETVSATVSSAPVPPRPRKPLPDNVVDFQKHPVIRALETAGRPVNNNELAELLGVTKGEASKSWREVADRLDTQRVGRELKIALR